MMTVVGIDAVEGGLFELPYLPDSPEDDSGGELETLFQPRTNAVGVPAEVDTDLDNGLLFGEPRVLGSAMGGLAWYWLVSLDGGTGLDEQKLGWDPAYWVGLVGWPALSNPSLDEKRELLPSEIGDGFGVLRLPSASDPSMGG